MKRFLICALAAVGMVACVSEDVVQLPKSEAISFADAFIGNSTRAEVAADPSTTKANLEAFDVWAYMKSTIGTVLVDEDLTLQNDGSWYYSNTQYWTPERDYFFAALAPMNSNNWDLDASYAIFGGGAGLVTFENIDGSEDLIYATASASTPDRQTLVDEGMPAVKFQFEHLLSKVKFTFHNGFKTDNARLEIKNVTMTAPKSGKINLSDADYMWTLDKDEFTLGYKEITLNFGNVGTLSTKDNVNKLECDDERLTIPADETYTYTIQFDVTLYYGEEVAYEVTKKSAVTGVALEKGHAYNFFTEINPQNLELPAIVFEVEGVDKWIPEDGEDVEHPVVATINNVPYTSLQAAVDYATAQGGDTTIEVVSPVNELVTVTQTEGVNLVINGNKNNYNGTIRVSGRSNYDGAETLVINGFKFKANTSEPCVDMYWGTSNETRYAHNVTISNCTFEMVGAAVKVAPAIDLYQPYNITVKGCEVKNGHSLLQVKGGHYGITVEDVTVVGCKNGIAFGTHDDAVSVKNADIKADGYGIRIDGVEGGNCTLENVNIEALRPVVVRKVTGAANNSVAFLGTNTLTTTAEYQVIFTAGGDEDAYSAPSAFTVTGADDFTVFPYVKATVNTVDELNSAIINDYAIVNVVADIDNTTTSAPYVQLSDVQDVTLNFNGNTLKSGSAADYGFIAKNNTEVTINNVELKSAGGGVAVTGGSKIIFNGESVYVDSASTSARYNFYAAAGEIVINAGTFSWDSNDNNKRAYVYASAGTKVTINGGTFGKASARDGYTAGILGAGEVVINGGTFGFDPTAWVASGRTVTKSGSTWTVQ